MTARDALAQARAFSSALAAILERVGHLAATVTPRFPLYLEPDGRWNTTADGNWCAGYWIGLQFLAAKHAASDSTRRQFTDSAMRSVERMRAQMPANIFAGVNHYFAGFWGYDVTGDSRLRDLGIYGADAMRSLYNPIAEQIPIGMVRLAPFDDSNPEDGSLDDLMDVAAVDVIHTSLPILWRASAETGDASYAEVALAHARRHLDLHCRPDGSTIQMTRFDSRGAPVERLNPLGHDLASCWSRGLAWNVAGLAEAYVATGAEELLRAVERSMRYFWAAAPDGIPRWDLAVRSGARDSSAAAIIAYGLLRLAEGPDAQRTASLEDAGRQILAALIDRCLVIDGSSESRGGIRHGCYQFPQSVAVDTELIWGDFYVAAALDLASKAV